MWIGMAIFAALFLVYKTSLPGIQPDSERVAYLRTTTGSEMQVTKINRNQCLAMKQRLWAESDTEVACIAYLTPVIQPEGKTAVVFFHGDFPKEDQTEKDMAISRRGYEVRASRVAQAHKVPVYVIARPGVMGSTGFHVIGGVRHERALITSAVSQLKQRYGHNRLVLGGQSGGARLSAQLLASGRTDLNCVVMASGAYGIPHAKSGGRMPTNIWGEPSRSYLIPLRSIDDVVTDGGRRLFVVGDLRDKRTPFAEQREWAEALKRAGHHVVLLQARGRGKEFHGLSQAGLRIAGMCAAGESDRAISAYVRRAHGT